MRERFLPLGPAVAVLVAIGPAACGRSPAAAAPALAARPAAAEPSPPITAAVPRSSGSTPDLLTPKEARQYMVRLINRDRATAGLRPVTLDEGPATRAGQRHADDMAAHGYLGHWGTDGSVPEQRFTEAGGVDMVLENASCFTDGRSRPLDPGARIERRLVEQVESMFFDERPPNDGHRRNILQPQHARVGIGVAQPAATPTEIPVPCFAQEFVDAAGTYDPVPASLPLGARLHVAGSVAPPAVFAGVGLARIDAPAPIPVGELNRRRSYPVPAPYQMYWPAPYKTPIPVRVTERDGAPSFSIDVPVDDRGRPGLYEVSVWAKLPRAADFVMVSLRTIRVR